MKTLPKTLLILFTTMFFATMRCQYRLAAGLYDGTIIILNTLNGKILHKWKAHNKRVKSVIFSPDGKKLISNTTKAIKVWDPKTRKLLKTVKPKTKNLIFSLALSPDCKTIAIGMSSGTIEILDFASGNLLRTLKGPAYERDFFKSLAFSPNGETLVAGEREGGEIAIWNVTNGNLIRKIRWINEYQPIYSLAFSPDGKTFASASAYDTPNGPGIIDIWDLSGKRQCSTILDYDFRHFFSIAFSPCGKSLLSGGASLKNEKFSVCEWDPKTNNLIRRLKGQKKVVYSVAFSPDGKLIACGSIGSSPRKNIEKRIKIWDHETGKLLNEIATKSGVYSVTLGQLKKTWLKPRGQKIKKEDFEKRLQHVLEL